MRTGPVPLAVVLAALVVGAADPSGDAVPSASPPPAFIEIKTAETLASRPVRGLGPRLARRIREAGTEAMQRFIARGLDPAAVEAEGGSVGARIGPIVAGTLAGEAILRLAPFAEMIEAPQPLHPLLDVSRVLVGADKTDQGRRLPARYRGKGAIVAVYDSGLDLAHPDMRELDGTSRVLVVWDQTVRGVPPPGHRDGNLCRAADISANTCSVPDPTGHGTHVVSIAAGNGPQYRGVAPEASIVFARSDNFDLFAETLGWFNDVAASAAMPLVVNLSLGGHQGPHDGTSLEAQTIDQLGRAVIAAAGNEGQLPVHALANLGDGGSADVVLRFPMLPADKKQGAAVEVWGIQGGTISVRAMVLKKDGTILAHTSSVGVGSRGRTEDLRIAGTSFGKVSLDPEATPNAFNMKSHVALSFDLTNWQDPPNGPGLIAVHVEGKGRTDLWVDSPPSEPSPVAFDRDGMITGAHEIAADTDLSVSDPATAASAIAVSAYTSRTEFPSPKGVVPTGGAVGAMAPFSSYGPTLAPDKTGPKPDIAAPGLVVIGARSKDAPQDDSGIVSNLYRASAGTSVAAPHVAGVCALILGANPKATKQDLKRYLTNSADHDGAVNDSHDSRWGAGKLDAAHAVETALGVSEGCGCTALGRRSPSGRGVSGFGVLVASLVLGRLRRLRAPYPRVT